MPNMSVAKLTEDGIITSYSINTRYSTKSELVWTSIHVEASPQPVQWSTALDEVEDRSTPVGGANGSAVSSTSASRVVGAAEIGECEGTTSSGNSGGQGDSAGMSGTFWYRGKVSQSRNSPFSKNTDTYGGGAFTGSKAVRGHVPKRIGTSSHSDSILPFPMRKVRRMLSVCVMRMKEALMSLCGWPPSVPGLSMTLTVRQDEVIGSSSLLKLLDICSLLLPREQLRVCGVRIGLRLQTGMFGAKDGP